MEEENQTTEVRQTTERNGGTKVRRENVRTKATVSSAVMIQRVVYYVGGVIVALLALRLLFQLLGANQSAGFVDLLYGVTAIFVAPFYGIFGEPTYGQSHFETATLVAIVIYALLTMGIAKLFALGQRNPEI
jgi:hypothetical protein